ncbi:hypothetical protein ACSKZ4_000202 [Vibrio alginolyticus]
MLRQNQSFLAALPRDQWPDYFAMVDKLLTRDGLLIGCFVIDDDYHSRFPPFCLRSEELEGYLEPMFKLVESSVVANSVEVFKGRSAGWCGRKVAVFKRYGIK